MYCYGNISTYCIFVSIKVNMYITGSGVLVSGDILTCIAPGGRFYLSHRKRYVSVSVFRAIEETRRSSLVFH